MQLYVHGSRGSSTVSGPAFARHGGYTTCFEVVMEDGHHLVIDAGSGLLRVQAALAEAGTTQPFQGTIFFTHFHWDHIQGLPFFAPVYASTSAIRLIGAPPAGHTVRSALADAIRPPWFPVPLAQAAASLSFEALPGQSVRVGDVEVTSVPLNHPGGVSGFRIARGDHSLVIATDVEAGDPASDAALRTLAEGASVLIHDAQYTPGEWATTRRGWGHSTWEHATAVAAEAHVDRLLLTSHDPDRTDEGIDEIVRAARQRFPATEAAFEGQIIEF
ncbi:MAG: MBL fold metallo-hydrolase [Dehalococcoidia bacterium]